MSLTFGLVCSVVPEQSRVYKNFTPDTESVHVSEVQAVGGNV